MDWLKQLLGEDLFNQLFPKDSDALKKATDKIGAKKFIEDDGKLIPKHRFDEISTKKDEFEKELKTANEKATNLQKDFDSLKIQKDSNKTEVEKQLEKLQKDFEVLKTASDQKDVLLTTEKKSAALTNALTNAKANPKYLQLLKKEFNLDKIEFEADGNIKDFAEMLKPVQENFKDLFGEIKYSGSGPQGQNQNQDNFTELTAKEYYASKASNNK